MTAEGMEGPPYQFTTLEFTEPGTRVFFGPRSDPGLPMAQAWWEGEKQKSRRLLPRPPPRRPVPGSLHPAKAPLLPETKTRRYPGATAPVLPEQGPRGVGTGLARSEGLHKRGDKLRAGAAAGPCDCSHLVFMAHAPWPPAALCACECMRVRVCACMGMCKAALT